MIVLTDGSRVEVLSYRVKDRVMVFETTEGKLRSLPLAYIDLGATDRANRRATIEPEPATSTPVEDTPASHDALARQVLELYGVEELVTGLCEKF